MTTAVLSDPWRYECPECGAASSRVHSRPTDHLVVHDTDAEGMAPYYCYACRTPVEGLRDKKDDRLINGRVTTA
jgi:DNA-directed RNA polymerase subunit RPC12/RpoP